MPFARVDKNYQVLAQEDPVTSDGSGFRNQARMTPRTQCIRTAIYLVIEAMILITVFFIYDRGRAVRRRSPDFTERCKDAKKDRYAGRTEMLNAMDY